MEAEDLPDDMRDMTKAERKAHVDKLAKERADLQAKIEKLAGERRDYVAKKEAEQAAEGQATLGGAMIKAVRAQAESAGFEFDR
jgi:Skp family chaperone for outer membrane proteins